MKVFHGDLTVIPRGERTKELVKKENNDDGNEKEIANECLYETNKMKLTLMKSMIMKTETWKR